MVEKDKYWIIEIQTTLGSAENGWITVGPRWLELTEKGERPIKSSLMKPQTFEICITAMAYWHEECGYIDGVRIRNKVTNEVIPIEIFG